MLLNPGERCRSKRADARDIAMPSASIDEGVGVDANDDGRMEEGAVELGGPGDAPNGDEGASVPHPHAGQKPGSAVFNLSSAIIGAGIMAIPNAFRVLGVTKSMERIADHCTNICEQVIYLETGKIVRHDPDGWTDPQNPDLPV